MWPLRGSHLTVAVREKDPPWGWSAQTILEEAALTSNLRLPLFLIIRSLDFINRIANVVFVARKVSFFFFPEMEFLFLVSIEGDGEWECYIYAQNRTIPFFFAILLGILQSDFLFLSCCVFYVFWIYQISGTVLAVKRVQDRCSQFVLKSSETEPK